MHNNSQDPEQEANKHKAFEQVGADRAKTLRLQLQRYCLTKLCGLDVLLYASTNCDALFQ